MLNKVSNRFWQNYLKWKNKPTESTLDDDRRLSVIYLSKKNVLECEEYSLAVYEDDGDKIFSLRSLVKTHQISTCALYDNPLIIGGTPARSREFPHMVSSINIS